MNTTNTVDSDPLGVEQPIPENNDTVSPLCPVILIMDDTIYFPSLNRNVIVTDLSSSNTIFGTINVNPYVNPNHPQQQSMIIFSPYVPFPENSTIEFRLKYGVSDTVWLLFDDDGHTLAGSSDYVLTFHTGTIDPNGKSY